MPRQWLTSALMCGILARATTSDLGGADLPERGAALDAHCKWRTSRRPAAFVNVRPAQWTTITWRSIFQSLVLVPLSPRPGGAWTIASRPRRGPRRRRGEGAWSATRRRPPNGRRWGRSC